MSEKNVEKKKQKRQKKQHKAEENTIPQEKNSENSEDRGIVALKKLLEKDKDRIKSIAMHSIHKEITDAVRSFAEAAKIAKDLEDTFDEEFNELVLKTFTEYFKALENKVFGEVFKDKQVKEKSSYIMEKDSQQIDYEDEPKKPNLRVTRRSPSESEGIINELSISGVEEGVPEPVVIKNTKVKIASGGASVSTVNLGVECPNCGWEGTEGDCEKKVNGNIVSVFCPECKSEIL